MRKLIVPLALVAMTGLIAGAFAFDCVRLAGTLRARVDLADREVGKHEERLAKLLESSPHRTSEVAAAIAAYKAATDAPSRRTAYDELVASFRQTMTAGIDPTNPLERRFSDDTAGAINRREIANKTFAGEWAEYQDYLHSRRGQAAQWFSADAAADAQHQQVRQ